MSEDTYPYPRLPRKLTEMLDKAGFTVKEDRVYLNSISFRMVSQRIVELSKHLVCPTLHEHDYRRFLDVIEEYEALYENQEPK